MSNCSPFPVVAYSVPTWEELQGGTTLEPATQKATGWPQEERKGVFSASEPQKNGSILALTQLLMSVSSCFIFMNDKPPFSQTQSWTIGSSLILAFSSPSIVTESSHKVTFITILPRPALAFLYPSWSGSHCLLPRFWKECPLPWLCHFPPDFKALFWPLEDSYY